MVKNILVIVGGNKAKLEPFLEAGKNLTISVTIASFSELNFRSDTEDFVLNVGSVDVKTFDLIYIRMVGKRVEDATLLANYAQKHGIPVYDSLYGNSLLLPSSLAKTIELTKLISGKVPLPKTFFASVAQIESEGESVLGFPYVIKSTTGKKSREVWSPETKEKLTELIVRLKEKEKNGMRFFAQELISASERIRVFVLGGKALAAIVRPTKWRKRFGEIEGRHSALSPIPAVDRDLAEMATAAAGLEIAGVDVIHDDKTGQAYILEVNAAPSWKALAKDTGLFIEEEILKFFISDTQTK